MVGSTVIKFFCYLIFGLVYLILFCHQNDYCVIVKCAHFSMIFNTESNDNDDDDADGNDNEWSQQCQSHQTAFIFKFQVINRRQQRALEYINYESEQKLV